ncbi:MAG: tripeptide aminopeptidase [Solirubrobacteraceae bacterium]|nr:tripeptide aminopeptidase [Solirubrobacteraceae bacterium]
MRPASQAERRRLNETFAALCAIPSPSGSERGVADAVASELREMGLEVAEDATQAETGAGCGNLVVRIPSRREGARTILLGAHMDTVAVDGPIEPVVDEGLWTNARDAILGADNKVAVAVLVEVARRVAVEGAPVGLELVFTTGEEVGLRGARALDAAALRARSGYVFDNASPLGAIVVASPTLYHFSATFHGLAAHAGVRPEAGRSAVLAAARAIAAMPQGRIDAETTANVASVRGGHETSTNIVPDTCTITGECRSLDDAQAEATLAAIVDAIHDGANDPANAVDVDVTSERHVRGFRLKPNDPVVAAAERALRACGHEPSLVPTGGASDANAFLAHGIAVVNLANGTERNHQPDERVSVQALEGMLDVALALLDACAEEDEI